MLFVGAVLPPESRELETSIRKTQQEGNNNFVWSTLLLTARAVSDFQNNLNWAC